MDSDCEDSDAYSSSAQDMSYASDSDEGYGFGIHAEVETEARKASYLVYNERQLKERQDEAVKAVTNVLSISESDAVRVLRHCRWDANRVNEEWFADTDRLRGKVGLQAAPVKAPNAIKVTCMICFDNFKPSDMCAGDCKHYFCKDCWKGYVSNAVASGPTVLSLRCPIPACTVAVPWCIMEEVLGSDDRAHLDSFALRSYVEDNDRMVWCPAPNCEHAVEGLLDSGREPLDVTCACGNVFCFACKEEAHRPVDCEIVHQWLVKNSAESENLNWILANTKPCCKCKRPIEKNQGCMHMTCSQCKHEFCWLCLGPWSHHGEGTGGFYACNRYETAKKKGEYDEENERREHAKNSLERYMHYYQRWAENDKARIQAIKKMKDTNETTLEKLSNHTATPTSQLRFVLDAWAQVVECRRILKWTYAYGYYRFADAGARKQQQDFFEFNQGQAEYFLEKLHSVVEKQLLPFLNDKFVPEGWGKFRENLIGLTDVTSTHFDKLVTELEKGLENLMADYQGVVPPSTAPADAASRAAAGQSSSTATASRRGAKRGRGARAGPSSMAADAQIDLEGDLFWRCQECTYNNLDLNSQKCEMCNHPREQG